MIQGKTVLAIIPARGGSKGVPRKNIRELGGKPLIAWTIEAAHGSQYLDRVILSTDDEEIADVARRFGCEVPFMRPKELAQDHTSGIAPVLHALESLERYDYVVLLQPTSPLRSSSDIDECIDKCLEKKANACVSVTLADKTPYWMYFMNDNNTLEPFVQSGKLYLNRQEAPDVYVLNGAIYIAKTDWLREEKTFLQPDTIAYVMPKERSVDIDTELDFLFVEALLKYSR